MVLKLAAGIPMVWRTPTSVQLGVEAPLVVLDEVTATVERLLAALEAGISRSGWQMVAHDGGMSVDDADALLGRLAPALARDDPASGRVLVTGEGALAIELAAQLADVGLLTAATDPSPDLVVLVAAWVVGPDDHGTWLRRDIPHLPVVLGDAGVTVGPFVEPGRGPCLYCVHLTRVDADPAWPAIATQLWGRPAPPLTRTAVAAAAAFTTRRIVTRFADMRAGELPDPATVWRIVSDRGADGGAVSAQQRSRHPSCSCAAPLESDWAPGAGRGTPRATTTARAAAVPA
ncbi:cyclodehydratase [soil metagenome]